MSKDAIQEMNATTDYAAASGHSEIEDLRRQVRDLTEKYGTMPRTRFPTSKIPSARTWATSSGKSVPSLCRPRLSLRAPDFTRCAVGR